MEELRNINSPWDDDQPRYVGAILIVEPVLMHADADEQHFILHHACWESIPDVTFSSMWLKWAKQRCMQDVDEDKRLSFFLLTATKNMATGEIRVIGADWAGTKRNPKRLLDAPELIWQAIGKKKAVGRVMRLPDPGTKAKTEEEPTNKAQAAPAKKKPLLRKKVQA